MQINKVDERQAKSIPFSQVRTGEVFRMAAMSYKNAALFVKTQTSQRVRLYDGYLLDIEEDDACVLVNAVVNATGDKD